MPCEWMFELGTVCWIIYVIWFIIWGVLMILSAQWVKTGDPEKVHKGAVLGLIASILGGLNVISLIGAILAFTWKPPAPITQPPPPPPI